MATPSEKLAGALDILRGLQKKGTAAIRSEDLLRDHRERLLRGGFLQEVIKGWYIPIRPDEPAGESTAWYASYWDFCTAYLRERFYADWCVSPEQSLLIHSGNRTVPRQLLVRTPKGGNKVTMLLHDTSLLDVRAAMPADKDIVEIEGLRLYTLPVALVGCSPSFYYRYPVEARSALAMVRDAADVLVPLLTGGHSTIAGRLAGGFYNIGRVRMADDIVKTMRAAGYTIRVVNPFENAGSAVLPLREISPYVNRLRLMWEVMRTPVIKRFPVAPGLPMHSGRYLAHVEEIYATDAYHSLSIEGYRVNPELIKRVRGGNWDPDDDNADRAHHDALAARGYWQAYRTVRDSLARVLKGENAGTVVEEDHRNWYREMFSPSVAAGLVRAADLAGYRNSQVYIRRSMHVPPRREAIREQRSAYMDALEQASVHQNIVPFADFISGLVEAGL